MGRQRLHEQASKGLELAHQLALLALVGPDCGSALRHLPDLPALGPADVDLGRLVVHEKPRNEVLLQLRHPSAPAVLHMALRKGRLWQPGRRSNRRRGAELDPGDTLRDSGALDKALQHQTDWQVRRKGRARVRLVAGNG